MRNRIALASTAAVALMLTAPAFAQTARAPATAPNGTATAPSGQQQMSRADLDFMKNAAIGGMAEVELGKLAQQNAQDEQVKQFGARMEQDHSQANAQLETVATGKGVQLPKQLDRQHQQDLDRLSRLRGGAFDHTYMRMMVQDHDKDLKEFKHEAQTARDPDLKQFAEQTTQVIQQHDQMAHEITRSLTATGSSRPRR